MMLRLAYATGSWLALRSSLRLVRERRRRIGENTVVSSVSFRMPLARAQRLLQPFRSLLKNIPSN
jgi:hypothetical protein